MTAPDSLPLHALAEDNLAAASPDLLRAMVKTFADALMSAEADALCNAEYGQVSDERVNHRNGYRPREWDTRAGTEAVAFWSSHRWNCWMSPWRRASVGSTPTNSSSSRSTCGNGCLKTMSSGSCWRSWISWTCPGSSPGMHSAEQGAGHTTRG